MTQIITVTPNPAIDVSTSVGKIAPFTKLRCASPRRDPGGGGINVARVVKRLGGEVAAIYPAGGAAGGLLRQLMDQEGVQSLAIPIVAETREDFTIFEDSTNQQYRFVMPGAPLTAPEWQDCLKHVESYKPRPDFVVASGSLPPGAPAEFFGRVARIAREMGAKMILDTSGHALKATLKEGVYLIKPNLREFQELTGIHAVDEPTLIDAGFSLIDRGFVKIIALSLGQMGAMLINGDGALRAEGLSIKAASVVGAGDSFLGALIWSLSQNHDLPIALSYATAAGSAALLAPGTDLCRVEDVKQLQGQVTVRAMPVRISCG